MNRCVALGLAVVLVGGCASKQKQMAGGTMPSGELVESVRASYKTPFPNAVVGVTTAVLDNKPYALVGQMDPAMVREGQVVSFLDANQKVVANGKVVKIDASGVTVMFDAGVRRPMDGDVAVRF